MNFYCRSYFLFNMFQAPLCPSSGAREYYTSGFCLSYSVLGFQVVGAMWSWGLWVRFAIKIHLLHPVGILFPHIIDDARSKPHQICFNTTDARCKHENYALHSYLILLIATRLEKLTFPKLIKQFTAFYGTWRFITARTRACHLPFSRSRSSSLCPPILFL
jgi:hypothetical protein